MLSGLFNIFGQVGLLIGAAAGMALIGPLLLGVVLAAMGVVVVISALASRRIRVLSTISQESIGILLSRLKSTLGALRTIRASNGTWHEHDRLMASVNAAQDAGLALARRSSIIQPLMNVFAQVAIVLVICVGAVRISVDLISADDLVTFALFLILIITPLGDLATVIVHVQSATGALKRILEVLGWSTEDWEPAATDHPRDRPSTVRLRRVSFRYPGSDTDALSDLNMDFPVGRTTAIVGPSGAGKSTVFNMLLRFFDPCSGEITVGGRSVEKMSRQDVRAHISYVPQDGGIVDGTLRENLAIGNPGLDETVALALLTGLGLDTLNGFADKGMDLDVGEQGVHLSGGERQRLALVRALLRQTPIVLLDEPTSSLDGKNELKFSQLLDQLSGARTIVVIAHRLQTIQSADRIYVLDHGRIEAAGQHDQLMSESSLYPQLMSTGDRHLS